MRKRRHGDVEQLAKAGTEPELTPRFCLAPTAHALGNSVLLPQMCSPCHSAVSGVPARSQLLPSPPGPGPHASILAARAHLAVAVASELRDEADVVIPDLDHLLADVVLGADAALCARPPGQRTTGSERASPRLLGGTRSFHSLAAPGPQPTRLLPG